MTLSPFVPWPEDQVLILASRSPRRAELLQTAGIPFEVIPASEVEAELAEADEEAKAAISKQIDNTKAKLEAINKTAKDKLQKTVEEGEAKLTALQEQISDASDKRKAKMEKRKAELEAEYKARAEKLEQAASLTKQALAV
mgnify:CR=1 FL=1